jgi:hypothetical protein
MSSQSRGYHRHRLHLTGGRTLRPATVRLISRSVVASTSPTAECHARFLLPQQGCGAGDYRRASRELAGCLSVPAHARNALWLSSAIEGITQLIRGSPPKSLSTTRWPQGLSRASIRIHSLLLADCRWNNTCHSGKVVQVGGIMTVYGLSVRRLTASQRFSCGRSIIEHVGGFACDVRRSIMRRCVRFGGEFRGSLAG